MQHEWKDGGENRLLIVRLPVFHPPYISTAKVNDALARLSDIGRVFHWETGARSFRAVWPCTQREFETFSAPVDGNRRTRTGGWVDEGKAKVSVCIKAPGSDGDGGSSPERGSCYAGCALRRTCTAWRPTVQSLHASRSPLFPGAGVDAGRTSVSSCCQFISWFKSQITSTLMSLYFHREIWSNFYFFIVHSRGLTSSFSIITSNNEGWRTSPRIGARDLWDSRVLGKECGKRLHQVSEWSPSRNR